MDNITQKDINRFWKKVDKTKSMYVSTDVGKIVGLYLAWKELKDKSE